MAFKMPILPPCAAAGPVENKNYNFIYLIPPHIWGVNIAIVIIDVMIDKGELW